MNEEKNAKKTYDLMAKSYHNTRTKKYPKGWFYNEMLEMPATLSFLGNVKGKKILDFGCGTGIYAKLLTKKGAKVKGFDISPKMIKIAKEENPNLDLIVGSGYKIPFKEKFDVVIAPLVLHYLKDWNKVFKQVRKVLNKNGIFIFSTGNPVAECREKITIKGKKLKILSNYFKEGLKEEIWKFEDVKPIKVKFYHNTYETIMNTIIKNDFEIMGYKDAYPLKHSKKYFPKDYESATKIPIFTIWKIKLK
jgi:SAM-dependent methyltransferase|tara:strand:+ start:1207 stop:1953 length:747 start_codon:yes stop_codon:yes gene_type:complete